MSDECCRHKQDVDNYRAVNIALARQLDEANAKLRVAEEIRDAARAASARDLEARRAAQSPRGPNAWANYHVFTMGPDVFCSQCEQSVENFMHCPSKSGVMVTR